MNVNSYQDINGRWHAPVMNAYNNYCWYITGLQRLQCSSTLANLLNDSSARLTGGSESDRKVMQNIIDPIKIMNKLNASNGKAIVDELRTYFSDHSEVYKSSDGFSSNLYLSKYILPIVYNMNGGNNDMTVQIMKEVGMDSASIYIANEVVSDDKIPILSAAEENSFREYIYRPFHEGFVNYIQKNPFKSPKYASAEMELWSATNSGHVVPIIQKQTGGWMVFDDHRFVGDLKDYLSQPYNFHKVKFSLTDGDFKRYVCGEVNKMSGGARSINNFEITESLVYLTLTNRNSTQIQTNPLTMAGGANPVTYDKPIVTKIVCVFAFCAIILAIILIIIVKRITRLMEHIYDTPEEESDEEDSKETIKD